MMRSAALPLLLLVACYQKPDLASRPDCSDDGCSSSGAELESSTGGTHDDGPVTSVTTSPTTSTSTSTSTSGTGSSSTEESSSGAELESSGEASSSTTAPEDNLFAPCASDEECTSGYCAGGFCSQVCWSQLDGETPCPGPPEGSVGVTIVCDRIGVEKGPGCKGCFDCAQYCIASCTSDSTCPSGGSCIANGCAPGPDYGYCG